jgi:phosphatidylserine synthase
MAVITIGVSLPMVSTIRYDTLPKPNASGFRKAPIKSAAIVLGVVIVIATRGMAIFPVMAVYLLFGLIRQCITWFRDRNDDLDDTMEDEDETPFDM